MVMKRSFSILLIITMLLTMVVGCSPKTSEEGLGVVDTVHPGEQNKDPEEPDDPKEESTPEDRPVEDETPAPDAPPASDDQTDPAEPEDEQPGEDFVPDEEVVPKDPEIDDSYADLPPVEKENSGTPITFLAQNIIHAGVKYGEKGDGTGNNLYNRLRRFKTMVMVNDPDVIFLNEARRGTLDFLEKDHYFMSNYKVVWKYRYYQEGYKIAGGDQAEPVLYKYNKYNLLESGHFWLSATPNKPSKSYDSNAEYGDISSWVYLKDKKTGSDFYAYCTHFSPSGSEVPRKAMAQYHKEVEKIRKKDPNAYVFVGGDYNVYYRSDTRYEWMMNWDRIIDLRDMALNMYDDGLTELGGMANSHNLAYGAGEQYPTVSIGRSQIDYVMACPNPHMAVDYYGFDYTIYDHPEDDVAYGHISDHWGLVTKVRIDTDADYSQYQIPHIYGEDPVFFNAEINYYER